MRSFDSLVGLAMVVLVVTGASLGVGLIGLLVSWPLPLSPFEATMVVLGICATVAVTLAIHDLRDSIYRVFLDDDFDESSEEETSQPPYLHPVLPFEPQDLPGHNDPCPCGSGKRYSECCGPH